MFPVRKDKKEGWEPLNHTEPQRRADLSQGICASHRVSQLWCTGPYMHPPVLFLLTSELGLLQQPVINTDGANCLSFLQDIAPHLFHLSTDPEIQLPLSFLVSLTAEYNSLSLLTPSDLPALQLVHTITLPTIPILQKKLKYSWFRYPHSKIQPTAGQICYSEENNIQGEKSCVRTHYVVFSFLVIL